MLIHKQGPCPVYYFVNHIGQSLKYQQFMEFYFPVTETNNFVSGAVSNEFHKPFFLVFSDINGASYRYLVNAANTAHMISQASGRIASASKSRSRRARTRLVASS